MGVRAQPRADCRSAVEEAHVTLASVIRAEAAVPILQRADEAEQRGAVDAAQVVLEDDLVRVKGEG